MKIKGKNLLYIFISVSIICLIIYRPLFRGYLPIFNDIGADTYNQNYVFNKFVQNQLIHGRLFDYNFNVGLGSDCFNLYSMSIFQLIYYFFPPKCVVIAMAVGNYLCILFSAFFSFYIFKHFKVCDKSAFCGAIIWAFSGYIMLWGQHFDFSSAYATVTLYILLLVRCKFEKIRDMYWVIAGLTLVLLCSYYWLYMVGIFTAIYVLIITIYTELNLQNRNNSKNDTWCIARHILKSEFLLLFSGLMSCVIGFFVFYRGISGYLNSTRTAAVTSEHSVFGIIYNLKYFITDIARFFSNNIVGVGNEYTGAYNYYEGTILCTSGLALYSIFYFLLRDKDINGRSNKKKVYAYRILLILAVIASISFPIFTKYLTFNDKKQRWTFVILFLVIGCIVSLLNDLFKHNISEKMAKRIVLSAGITFVISFLILFVADRYGVCDVKKTEAVYAAIPFGLYGIIIYIYSCHFDLPSFSIGNKVKGILYRLKNSFFDWIYSAVVLVLLIEMVLLNSDTFNKRILMTQADIDSIFYDGTENASLYLKSTNDGLYRVSKNYISASLNEARIQGYNGFSDYNAVEKKSVAEYMLYNDIPFEQIGEYSRVSKYINVPWNDYVTTSLLGMRYVFSKNDIGNSDYLNLVERVDGINIYKNKNAIPFGYLYNSEIAGGDYRNLSVTAKRATLISSFYYTNKINKSISKMATNLDLPAEYQTLYSKDMSKDSSKLKDHYEANIEKDHTDIKSSLQNLIKNGAKKVHYKNDCYIAEITNRFESEGMMCVPIFYEHEWKAYVDGKETNISNINGGLIGIKIASGNHHIKVIYDRDPFYISVAVSVFALILFIAWGITIKAKKNKEHLLMKSTRADKKIKKNKYNRKILFVIIPILGMISFIVILNNKNKESKWKITQYNTTTGSQAMFYTIEDKKGNLSIVDGGYNCDGDISQIIDVIRKHDSHVYSWILTHPHHDHIGAFNGLYPYADKIGIKIDHIYATDANRSRIVEMARENTDDVATYDAFVSATKNTKGIKYVHKGDNIEILPEMKAKVFHAWDKVVNELNCNPCNNGSIMFKIFGHKESMLFCADNEEPVEEFIIADYGNRLSADYVQCGHHGSTGLSTKFYDIVGAKKGAFFDGPDILYQKGNNGFTGYILQNYFSKKKIPIYKLSGAPNVICLK